MKYFACFFVLLFLALFPSGALETAVAEFYVTSDNDQGTSVDTKDFNTKMFAKLVSLDTKGSVGFHFHPAADTNGVVRSAIDAVQASEVNGWETLVYGQLTQRQTSFDVEIRIYSHGDRKILRTILLRASLDDYKSLVDDCAQKIFDYFAQLLYLNKTDSRYITEKNSWILEQGAFWWGVAPPWNQSLVPIVGYRGTYAFRLGDPLWTNGEWTWLQEVGLFWGFAYATNALDVIPSNLYDGEFGPEVTWDMVWQRQQEFTLTVVPNARFHFLVYQPLHDKQKLDAAVWYGAILDFGYRLWIDPQRTFGLGLEGGASSYLTSPFFMDYHVGASLVWKGVFP